ncbi:Hypothetical protein NocV09_07400180 [Nannochloropsis oceanica]
MTTPPPSPRTHKPIPSAPNPTPPSFPASIPLGLPPRPPTSSSLENIPALTRASTPPILLIPKAVAAGGCTQNGVRGGECCDGACSGFELIAKMAIDHQEAFPAEHENGKGKAGREEEGEEGGGAAADAAAPFATKAEGRKSPPSALPLLALPREVLRDACSYLRAWDLSALVQTCRALGDEAESRVVEEVALHSLDLLSSSSTSPSLPAYSSSSTASPGKVTALGGATSSSLPSSPPALSSSSSSSSSNHKDGSGQGLGVLLERLRFQEIQHVHRLLSLPEPLAGGYYVSVPWSEVNADITCIHGSLMPLQRQPSSSPSPYASSPPSHPPPSSSSSSSSSPASSCPLSLSGSGLLMGRRKTIEKRAWRALRRFYPEGKAFKVATTSECPQCSRKDREEKERLEEERKARDAELAASPSLTTLFARRTGCPPSSFAAAAPPPRPPRPPLPPLLLPLRLLRLLLPSSLPSIPASTIYSPAAGSRTGGTTSVTPRPLVLGRRTSPSSSVRPTKKGVLSSLNGRSGVVCEILSVEEWEELMKIFPTDYCLKFSVDPRGPLHCLVHSPLRTMRARGGRPERHI